MTFFTCAKCKKQITLPEGEVKGNQSVGVKCPHCGEFNLLTIDFKGDVRNRKIIPAFIPEKIVESSSETGDYILLRNFKSSAEFEPFSWKDYYKEHKEKLRKIKAEGEEKRKEFYSGLDELINILKQQAGNNEEQLKHIKRYLDDPELIIFEAQDNEELKKTLGDLFGVHEWLKDNDLLYLKKRNSFLKKYLKTLKGNYQILLEKKTIKKQENGDDLEKELENLKIMYEGMRLEYTKANSFLENFDSLTGDEDIPSLFNDEIFEFVNKKQTLVDKLRNAVKKIIVQNLKSKDLSEGLSDEEFARKMENLYLLHQDESETGFFKLSIWPMYEMFWKMENIDKNLNKARNYRDSPEDFIPYLAINPVINYLNEVDKLSIDNLRETLEEKANNYLTKLNGLWEEYQQKEGKLKEKRLEKIVNRRLRDYLEALKLGAQVEGFIGITSELPSWENLGDDKKDALSLLEKELTLLREELGINEIERVEEEVDYITNKIELLKIRNKMKHKVYKSRLGYELVLLPELRKILLFFNKEPDVVSMVQASNNLRTLIARTVAESNAKKITVEFFPKVSEYVDFMKTYFEGMKKYVQEKTDNLDKVISNYLVNTPKPDINEFINVNQDVLGELLDKKVIKYIRGEFKGKRKLPKMREYLHDVLINIYKRTEKLSKARNFAISFAESMIGAALGLPTRGLISKYFMSRAEYASLSEEINDAEEKISNYEKDIFEKEHYDVDVNGDGKVDSNDNYEASADNGPVRQFTDYVKQGEVFFGELDKERMVTDPAYAWNINNQDVDEREVGVDVNGDGDMNDIVENPFYKGYLSPSQLSGAEQLRDHYLADEEREEINSLTQDINSWTNQQNIAQGLINHYSNLIIASSIVLAAGAAYGAYKLMKNYVKHKREGPVGYPDIYDEAWLDDVSLGREGEIQLVFEE